VRTGGFTPQIVAPQIVDVVAKVVNVLTDAEELPCVIGKRRLYLGLA
jgi:hypothetical protein